MVACTHKQNRINGFSPRCVVHVNFRKIVHKRQLFHCGVMLLLLLGYEFKYNLDRCNYYYKKKNGNRLCESSALILKCDVHDEHAFHTILFIICVDSCTWSHFLSRSLSLFSFSHFRCYCCCCCCCYSVWFCMYVCYCYFIHCFICLRFQIKIHCNNNGIFTFFSAIYDMFTYTPTNIFFCTRPFQLSFRLFI